jgi:predicted Fe-S protein YdhL (DUF1289 family)
MQRAGHKDTGRVAAPERGAAYRATAESPCIKVCQLDLANGCRGCGRTLDEIRDWSSMSLDQRAAVNARLGFHGHERADT